MTASTQFVRRTPALIARTSEDPFLVSIQTQGRGVVSQDGRDALLGSGDLALYGCEMHERQAPLRWFALPWRRT